MAVAPARYAFGTGEHVFVEMSESMSLDAFFKGKAIKSALSRLAIRGVAEVRPANASYAVQFDPDLARLNKKAKFVAVDIAEALADRAPCRSCLDRMCGVLAG